MSVGTDGIKTQECCNEAWLCAVNANTNLLKEHEDQVLQQSTQILKTVNIKQHQDDDQAIKRVKEIILNNEEEILGKDKVKEDPAVQRLQRERKKLKVNSNSVLARSAEEIDQIVIPPSLKWLIYQEFHKKHRTSWSRKILPPSKVKSLLTKHGKKYQVFHRQ